MTEKDPYSVPSLVRGLAVLQGFTPHHPEQTLSQMAETLGITRSAAFRTVHTLVQAGFLLPVREGNHYRLGPSVLGLGYGYLASRELLEVAQSPLEKMRDELDWSAHLGVLDGRHILYLIRLPASDGLSSLVHVGSRLPASGTAMGRILLAQKSEGEVRKILVDQPERTVASVMSSWNKDQGAKYVTHIGSFESGLCSVAAPVFDMSGAIIAAISATKVADTISESVKHAVVQAAMNVNRGMGWTVKSK